jgi:hypothetical protein
MTYGTIRNQHDHNQWGVVMKSFNFSVLGKRMGKITNRRIRANNRTPDSFHNMNGPVAL